MLNNNEPLSKLDATIKWSSEALTYSTFFGMYTAFFAAMNGLIGAYAVEDGDDENDYAASLLLGGFILGAFFGLLYQLFNHSWLNLHTMTDKTLGIITLSAVVLEWIFPPLLGHYMHHHGDDHSAAQLLYANFAGSWAMAPLLALPTISGLKMYTGTFFSSATPYTESDHYQNMDNPVDPAAGLEEKKNAFV